MDNCSINITKQINTTNDIQVDGIKFQKMILLYNVLEKGWSIKKKNNEYTFKKKHENKQEIIQESQLHLFIPSVLNINDD